MMEDYKIIGLTTFSFQLVYI